MPTPPPLRRSHRRPAGRCLLVLRPAVTLVEAFSYLGAALVCGLFGADRRVSGQAAGATRDWPLVAGRRVPAAFFVIGLVFTATLRGSRAPPASRS
jgi:hypothetical protein